MQNDRPRRIPTSVRYPILGLTFATLIAAGGCAGHGRVENFEPKWDKLLVEVATFPDSQPNGVAVSKRGRVFVNFPWWSRKPSLSVAEILDDGTAVPFPSRSWNGWKGKSGPSALRGFVCAQSMMVDRNDFLWVLDSGNPRNGRGVVIAGPKLFKIDLSDDSIAQVYYFDHSSDFTSHSILSDFQVDVERQVAYISDSKPGSIYLYDLKRREGRTVLLDHPSTKAQKGLIPRIGSKQWRDLLGLMPRYGVYSMELSPDREWLYYSCLTGRTLYRVPTGVLRDSRAGTVKIGSSVEQLGDIGSIVDGMWMDRSENLYMAALERDAIIVRRPGGEIETFVVDQRMQWPDSVTAASDGYLYFTTSMRHLHAPYRIGDRRDQPYYVMKVSIANVQRANTAKRAADEASAAAAEAAKQAKAATQKLLAVLADIDHKRAEADRQAADAEQARLLAQTAAQRQADASSVAAQAATEQANVAQKAQEAAARAEAIAQQAQTAAELAAAAAQEARAKSEQAMQASNDARRSNEEVESARAAHERAASEAEAAAARASNAKETARLLGSAANAARARAKTAVAAAETEARAAKRTAKAAELAQTHAAAAVAKARAAEYIEINGGQVPATASVEAPTEP